MPLVKGFMNRLPVSVLRDTGCDRVVVREAVVPKEKLTEKYRQALFLGRTVQYLPEVVIFLDTPIFRREVRAHCLRDLVYDVVLGNIKGVISLDATTVRGNQPIKPIGTTVHPSGPAERSTAPWPNSRPDLPHFRGTHISQDEARLLSNTMTGVPPRRRPRQNYNYERHNTGSSIESHVGLLKLH